MTSCRCLLDVDPACRRSTRCFTDCTREDATVSTYPKAWTKLLHSVTANAEDICAVLMGHGCADAEGCPLVTFVIDRSAETDAQPQTVRVPAGVDVTKSSPRDWFR